MKYEIMLYITDETTISKNNYKYLWSQNTTSLAQLYSDICSEYRGNSTKITKIDYIWNTFRFIRHKIPQYVDKYGFHSNNYRQWITVNEWINEIEKTYFSFKKNLISKHNSFPS